jgi:2-polyprenyl-3-methyl-5-hydroxy-6-metoxy-1,4-benzoquinol methylase
MQAALDAVRSFDALFAAAARDPSASAGLDSLRSSWRAYEAQLVGDAEEIARRWPDFYARLEPAVVACRGVVLEIGCSLGQMTRWIALEEAVTRVVAVDRDRAALAVLRARGLDKVEVVADDAVDVAALGRVDTLVLCEFVEHVTTRDELELLRRYAPALSARTRFVISTPVGYLPDPTHVRGFSKTQFIEHVEGLYGPIEALEYRSGYSQVAVGRLERSGRPYRG